MATLSFATNMRIRFVRRGWPVRALAMMLLLYCLGQGLLVWVSKESGVVESQEILPVNRTDM